MINLYCHTNQNSRWVSNYEVKLNEELSGWHTGHFLDALNCKELFNPTTYDTNSKDGYYVIFYGSSLTLNQHLGLVLLTPEIIDKVNQGLLKLLLIYVHETFDTSKTVDDWTLDLLQQLNGIGIYKENSVVFFTSTDIKVRAVNDNRLQWIYYPWFEFALKLYLNNPPPKIDFSIKDRILINLNSQGRQHRLLLVMFLYYRNLIEKSYVSWHDEDKNTWDKTSKRTPGQFQIGFELEKADQDLLEFYLFVKGFNLPVSTLDHDPFTDHEKSWNGADEYYKKSCIEIVSETKGKVYNNTVFLTEKSFKPVFYGLPFIINGPQYHLEGIQQLGYQTFPELIDESYDQLPSSVEKVLGIGKQIEKLCNDPHLLQKIQLPEILEKLQYNQSLFWTRPHQKLIHQKLFESLIKNHA
jgi:hypothetical protein